MTTPPEQAMPGDLYVYETKLALGVTYWPHHGNRKTTKYTRADKVGGLLDALKTISENSGSLVAVTIAREALAEWRAK